MLGEKLKEVFGSFTEFDVHPHVPEERAILYSSIDGGSTECETLNFVNALVYSYKPKLCIETGVFRGFGTIAIASALKANGFGKVYAVELSGKRIEEARKHLDEFDTDLASYVEYVEIDSLEFITNFTAGKFQFAFLDSETWLRHQEFEALLDNDCFGEGAVAMFHDTSRYRKETATDNQDLIDALDATECKGGFEFPYSRGFRVVML